jgi:glutamyl-tRNA synthetase
MNSFLKTRIAPTPSGYLHLGNAVSFLLTEALARKTGARILLRIDDLDQERVRKEYLQDIFDTLHFFSIEWDEGPRSVDDFLRHHSQLHRMQLYKDALEQLEEFVFACNCSRASLSTHNSSEGYPGFCIDKKLPLHTPEFAWRLHTISEQLLQVNSPEGLYITSYLPVGLKRFVVRKKNGDPSYQLASVVDDLHYEVDLIIRGADLWDSTLAQLQLASVLQQPKFSKAAFVHHPLVKGEGVEKLSKSAGATSIHYLRKQGTTLPQLFLMMAQALGLSHTPKTKEELGTLLIKEWSGN